jgi:hypothetical protein
MAFVLTAAAIGVLVWTAWAASANHAAASCRRSPLRPLAHNRSFNFGTRRIAVSLPPRATFVAVPQDQPGRAFLQRNGWIRTKLGWWTWRGRRPHVAGHRTDGSTRPLRADVGPLSWDGSVHFYPSSLYFPSVGCWRITATAGSARLVAVVKVVKR